MPTILRSGPYRFFFWAYDCQERRHVHIEHDDAIAKLWLEPEVALEDGGGMSRKQLRDIEKIVLENQEELIREWDNFCSQHSSQHN